MMQLSEYDIVGKKGVLINGNSPNKNDLVVYISREGYSQMVHETIDQIVKDLKKEIERLKKLEGK